MNQIGSSNFSSPYVPTAVLRGVYTTHTSTAGVIYQPTTLPAPWPWLAASFGLSFLTACWGMLSPVIVTIVEKVFYSLKRIVLKCFKKTPKEKAPTIKWGIIKTIINGLGLLIGTVRAFSCIIRAGKGLHNNGAKFMPPMGLIVLLLSLIPYTIVKGAPLNAFNYLAMVDVMVVFVSLVIMVYGLMKSSAHYYARAFLTNGTCPVMVDTCEQLRYVGCGAVKYLNTGNEMSVNKAKYNMIHMSELIVGSLIFLGGVLVIIGAAYFIFGLVAGVLKFFSLLIRCFSRKHRTLNRTSESSNEPKDPEDILYEKKSNDDRMAGFAAASALAIIIIAAISIPVHYFQQVKPKSFYILDGAGPLATTNITGILTYNNTSKQWGWPNYKGENTTTGSWSDCFVGTYPHDKLGFWDTWVHEVTKGKWETVLAVV